MIDKVKELKADVLQLTTARDKFRTLTLDQKTEIRKLKMKISN